MSISQNVLFPNETNAGMISRANNEMTAYLMTNQLGVDNLGRYLVDPTFWEVLNSLVVDINTFVQRIMVFPCYIPSIVTSATEAHPIDFVGWVSGQPDNIKVATPGFTGTVKPLYTLFDKQISPKYGDFRDYGDRVKVRIFCPYLGYVEVPTNDVMGKYLKVYLGIDFPSGQGIYYICCGNGSGINGSGFRIISKHSVQLGIDIPIGSTNSYNVQRDLILSAVSVAGTAAIGALGGAAAVTTTTVSGEVVDEMSESFARGEGKYAKMKKMSESTRRVESSGTTRVTETKPGSGSIARSAFAASADALRGALISGSSTHTNSPGLEQWSSKYVIVYIERPVYPSMGNYAELAGKPLCAVRQLSNVHGYTEIGDIHIEGLGTATSGEIYKLKQALKGGVILP